MAEDGGGFQQVQNREDMIRFFEGYTSQRLEEIDKRTLNRPLVKTQLLETVAHENGNVSRPLPEIFGRSAHLTALESGLFSIVDIAGGGAGFVEHLNSRIIAIYSTEDVRTFTSWTRPQVERNPDLDYVWLSGLTFNGLWDYVVQSTEPHRYVGLSFSHRRIFDIDRDLYVEDDDEEEESNGSVFGGEGITERPATTSRLADRLGALKDRLRPLQDLYPPFSAISRLRLPSLNGRGGHDFYDDGRVTNRSGDFRDHRMQLQFVARVYEYLLNAIEDYAWYSMQASGDGLNAMGRLVGAPVVMTFQEPLSRVVFEHWITTTFERKRNRFRLWGKPTWLGPTKVHVHGVDRHLWQPLFLELTARGCTLILPEGTCGNVVHRFVTNIQRYLDPAVEASVGDKAYKQLVADSIKEALRGP